MIKSLRFLLIALVLPFAGKAQQPTLKGIYLSIPDASIITSVSPAGVPTFSDASVNSIIAQYTVTAFYQAFPTSNYEYLQEVYELDCTTGDGLGQALTNAFPQYFPHYELVYNGVPSSVATVSFKDALHIYPQPAIDRITIDAGQVRLADVSLYNMDGRVLYQVVCDGALKTDVCTGYLPTGSYLLEVRGADGQVCRQLVAVSH